MCALLRVVVVLDVLGKLTCPCPANMILYNKLCISLHKEKLYFDEARAVCSKNDGGFAGESFDIVSQLNTNPEFQKLLPDSVKDTAYWATTDDSLITAWLRLMWMTFNREDMFREVTYKNGKWLPSRLVISTKSQQFFCEFPEPKHEEPEKGYRGKTRKKTKARSSVILKQSEGMYHVKSIAFQTRVPSVMFCARTCHKNRNCDTLNFNPSSRICVGYMQDKADVYENTPGWEIWSFLLKSDGN